MLDHNNNYFGVIKPKKEKFWWTKIHKQTIFIATSVEVEINVSPIEHIAAESSGVK